MRISSVLPTLRAETGYSKVRARERIEVLTPFIEIDSVVSTGTGCENARARKGEEGHVGEDQSSQEEYAYIAQRRLDYMLTLWQNDKVQTLVTPKRKTCSTSP